MDKTCANCFHPRDKHTEIGCYETYPDYVNNIYFGWSPCSCQEYVGDD